MRFIDVDLEAQQTREVNLGQSYVDRYILPHLVLYKLQEEGAAPREGLYLVRSAISRFNLPGSSIVFLCVSREDNILCVPLFSKTISCLLARAQVDVIRISGSGGGTLLLDKASLQEEVTLPQLKLESNMVSTEIAITKLSIELPRVELSLVSEREAQLEEPLIAKRLRLLHELSPLTGPSRPIAREGFITLIRRLVGLELTESSQELVARFTAEKMGCSNCLSCCLNTRQGLDRHLCLRSEEVLTYVIDEDVRSVLSAQRLDAYYMIIVLYMRRFAYPEYVPDVQRFLRRAEVLYRLARLAGLCPLYMFHLAKSAELELDLVQELYSCISRRLIRLDALERLAEFVHVNDLVYSMSRDECREAVKLLESLPEGVYETRPVLEKLRGPVVQAALDLVADMDVVCKIARECAESGVKIIEIGTPLLKKYGIAAVTRIKQELSQHDVLIFADTKTMDVGDLEARMCYLAGADMIAVMGLGAVDKLVEALYEAVKFNKAVLLDLMQVPDPLKFLEENRQLVEKCRDWLVICLHRGITEQLRGRGIASDFDLVKRVREALPEGVRLAIAGGLKVGQLAPFAKLGVDILIVGAALYTSRNVRETARRLVEEVRQTHE